MMATRKVIVAIIQSTLSKADRKSCLSVAAFLYGRTPL